MKIYSLVGKSGTGKSYQATTLCEDKKITAIVDDGLFINEGMISAGISAKRQPNMVTAIKTALFSDEEHRSEVVAAIRASTPETLLIIGTSDKMIDRIKLRLGLAEADERIYIEDITSEEEREIAEHYRKKLGQHIVPAPTMQVKKHFSGYFVHPIRSFMMLKDKISMEKSVVRPTYSYMGNYSISESAIVDIIRLISQKEDFVESIKVRRIENTDGGISVALGIEVRYGQNIIETARSLQDRLAKTIDDITALYILSINIDIRGLRRDEQSA